MDNLKSKLLYDNNKKSGFVAAMLNMIFPGLGYVYCGRIILGIFAFLLFIAVAIFTLGYGLILLWPMFVIDGFLCANRANNKLLEKLL